MIAKDAETQQGIREHLDEDDLLTKQGTQPGERIYHYRTRTNRALLWFPTAFTLLAAGLIYLEAKGISEVHDIRVALAFTALSGLFTLWAYRGYRAAAIHTDRQGITQYGLFGKHSIDWGDVQDYYMSGGDALQFGNVVGSKTRIRFWIGITNLDELKRVIQHNATQSRRKEWDQALPARQH